MSLEKNKDIAPFIVTTDENTSNQLKKLGFTLVNEEPQKWTYLNDTNLMADVNGDELNLKKMSYTNIMCI